VRRRGALSRALLAASAAACLLIPSGLAGPADDVIAITGGPAGETTAREATFTFGPAAAPSTVPGESSRVLRITLR
jgi:hypothetical protein